MAAKNKRQPGEPKTRQWTARESPKREFSAGCVIFTSPLRAMTHSGGRLRIMNGPRKLLAWRSS
jgi:hypothetical protein